MPINHTEKAFEDSIEDSLLSNGGYFKGNPNNYYKELALIPTELFQFIEDTQVKVWDELKTIHKDRLEVVFLDSLVKNLETRGTLDLLRHGFKFYGKLIKLAYFAPTHNLNPDILDLYNKNRMTLTRQVRYSTENENSIDLLITLNGLPVATLELKNHLTGQTVEDAKRQYKRNRDPREKLFQFKRGALVHFAVDPDEVYMTTRLAGESTYFLPFNKGNNNGAGNPENPNGYKTAYLWEEILAKDSFLDIIGRFMHLQVDEKEIGTKKIKKETLIFPRYHQLDVVRKLEADAKKSGAGKNYLIQHSAGSGKSNSIAWLAYRLSSLFNESDEKVFDSVVVITDRRVLDRQLQDTIYQFEHKQGVVQKIDKDSRQLGEALVKGVPIIITTLQKFPFVTEKIEDIPKRKYAVIIDEAHSSQSGESAITMKRVLAAKSLEEAATEEAEREGQEDYEEEILKTMLARGRQPNISFFAFTATPKYKTLELFGTEGPDGKPRPFHLYSMRQAIEEHFILDVLKHYTTYKTYYKIIKAIEDDPEVDKKKAAKALARFMSLHPHNIAQKTEVMVEHFKTFTRHKIGGKAKAMVVTSSRLHAVRYKEAFDKYIKDKGYTDIKALVAFSGTVRDPDTGKEYTEVSMNNGLRETELPETFATGEYQVLLVADKYQTGFDQPLLHTMYVDKKLSGVRAVQTLSRLNRIHPGKSDTFILDFVNTTEEIKEAFQPYYESTTIDQEVDPQHLYTLQTKLDNYQVYYKSEVEGFCKIFFKNKVSQTKKDLALLNSYLDPAVDRFKALEEEEQEVFKKTLISYKNLYSFLSQIIPFHDSDLEKLYAYGRFLLTKLPRKDFGPKYEFDDEVALKYYRLQKISENESIKLESGGGTVTGPTSVGTGQVRETRAKLSTIIEIINERFGTNFTPADELFLEQIKEDASADEEIVQAARVNTIENFKLMWDQTLEELFINRMEQNQEIFAKYMNDAAFRADISKILMEQVYYGIREQVSSL